MAARPIHLLEAGIVTEQRFAGTGGAPAALGGAMAQRLAPTKRVRVPFQPRDRWLTAARESCRTLADAVTASLQAGALPVVIGGECTVVAGTITGALEVERDLALVYFDAHGDFNTLATTPSHFVGGMCLAHVCGRKLAPLLWPGVRSIAEDHVALVGARDLDPGEAGNLATSKVRQIAFDPGHSDAPGLLAFVRKKPVWLHVDIDVVDPSEIPAVSFPVKGGPSARALCDVLSAVSAVANVRGIAICAYDPRKDPGSPVVPALVARMAAAALSLAPAPV
jgi:arginase